MKIFISCIIGLLVSHHTGYGQQNDKIKLANEYYTQGELEKAKILYVELSKQVRNIPLIHNNYLFILLETSDFKKAEKYVSKLIKKFPNNLYYQLDLGLIHWYEGSRDLADKIFSDIITNISIDSYYTGIVAQYFASKQLSTYAIRTFSNSRKSLHNPYLYALEMANIYRIIGEKELMVEEYLNYIIQNPSNLEYVKNTLQSLLSSSDELESLESLLYQRIQKEPNSIIYSELLIWVSLQQKNFHAAFIQARAIDIKRKTQGEQSIRIGLIALDNREYDMAIKIFSYIIKQYTPSAQSLRARMYFIKAHEERVKNTQPIEEQKIRNLTTDYDIFIKEAGINRNTLEALRNKAKLHAFYLNEKDTAIRILQKIIDIPRADHTIRSLSKMDLGDIHLLLDQPWESVLYYAQVEKANKETKIGYQAKLKNAKLSYYKGDFALAEEHLNILKEATSREIANDAMDLSILIKDNIALDSTTEAMKEYAAVDLLLFQNKINEAQQAVSALKEKYANHPLMDEILWLEAKININLANYQYAADALGLIVINYEDDLWADDAYFKQGELYQYHLNNTNKAMEIYKDFLVKYPGSVYVAEARKRFRYLRGDHHSNKEM